MLKVVGAPAEADNSILDRQDPEAIKLSCNRCDGKFSINRRFSCITSTMVVQKPGSWLLIWKLVVLVVVAVVVVVVASAVAVAVVRGL